MRNRFRHQKRGAAIVETAVILPIALVFFIGVAEFGLMLMARQSVAIAAREGARAGARPGATAYSVESAVETVMRNAGYDGYTMETNVDAIDYEDRKVRVTVTLPWDRFAISGNLFGGGHWDIVETTTMCAEGEAPRD